MSVIAHTLTQCSIHMALLQKGYKKGLISTGEKTHQCHSTTKTKCPLASPDISKWLRIKSSLCTGWCLPAVNSPADKNFPQDFLEQPQRHLNFSETASRDWVCLWALRCFSTSSLGSLGWASISGQLE